MTHPWKQYDWQRLWTIKFWCADKHVCELKYIGGKIFTPHTLAHVLTYNKHLTPSDNITHITLSCCDGDFGPENDLGTTG